MFRGFKKRKPTIDPLKEAALDRALNHKGQQFVAQSIKNLEDDEPSMAWRASLNAKLAETAIATKKRNIVLRAWRPAAGLAAAGALAFMVFVNTGPMHRDRVNTTSDSIEFAAVDAHFEVERNLDLGSTHAVSYETTSESSGTTTNWEESDLGAF